MRKTKDHHGSCNCAQGKEKPINSLSSDTQIKLLTGRWWLSRGRMTWKKLQIFYLFVFLFRHWIGAKQSLSIRLCGRRKERWLSESVKESMWRWRAAFNLWFNLRSFFTKLTFFDAQHHKTKERTWMKELIDIGAIFLHKIQGWKSQKIYFFIPERGKDSNSLRNDFSLIRVTLLK